MRLITLAIIAGIMLLAMAFDAKKCDHIFTNIISPEVKMPMIIMGGEINPIGKIGKHEGPELICVKCFHRQKQVIDYVGCNGYELQRGEGNIKMLNNGTLKIDTCGNVGFGFTSQYDELKITNCCPKLGYTSFDSCKSKLTLIGNPFIKEDTMRWSK